MAETKTDSSATRQEKIKKLEGFFKKRKPDEVVTWLELEVGSSVTMHFNGKPHTANRELAREVLGGEYSAIHGSGLELAGPENSVGIVRSHIHKAWKELKGAQKLVTTLGTKHAGQMTEEKKREMAAQGALLGAVLAINTPTEVVRSTPQLTSVKPAEGQRAGVGKVRP